RFGSKCRLFLAVLDHADNCVYRRLHSVVRTQSTFVASLEAVLDEVQRLGREDPLVVRFLVTVGAELSQIAELRAARSDHSPRHRQAFVTELIEIGEG